MQYGQLVSSEWREKIWLKRKMIPAAGILFNAHLVAGLTPIEATGYLDFFIDRPLGMSLYFNLTIRGQGGWKIRMRIARRPGDILPFPPGRFITTVVIRGSRMVSQWFIFVRAPTAMNIYPAVDILPPVLRPMKAPRIS